MNEYIQSELENILRGRKYLITTYFFIVLAVIFYSLFFLNTPEPVVILCAFFCNIAAAVYVVKAIKFIKPLRQIYLAKVFINTKTHENLLKLCASLECAKSFVYGNYSRKNLQKALEVCELENFEVPEILRVKAQ